MTPNQREKEPGERPHLQHEQALWQNGALWVAGIDEAGRGALAGPVAVGAVILPKLTDLENDLYGVQDSKLMSPAERAYWKDRIKDVAVTWAVGFASPEEIDQFGIVLATRLASTRAVDLLEVCPDCLLLDYFSLPDWDLVQVSIPKGDRCSLSIAAASILAKTSRDAVLTALENQYPGYGFTRNKGYGTEEHRKALDLLGPSPVHRTSYAPIRNARGSDLMAKEGMV
jgi:ribonuclease HII